MFAWKQCASPLYPHHLVALLPSNANGADGKHISSRRPRCLLQCVLSVTRTAHLLKQVALAVVKRSRQSYVVGYY